MEEKLADNMYKWINKLKLSETVHRRSYLSLVYCTIFNVQCTYISGVAKNTKTGNEKKESKNFKKNFNIKLLNTSEYWVESNRQVFLNCQMQFCKRFILCVSLVVCISLLVTLTYVLNPMINEIINEWMARRYKFPVLCLYSGFL